MARAFVIVRKTGALMADFGDCFFETAKCIATFAGTMPVLRSRKTDRADQSEDMLMSVMSNS